MALELAFPRPLAISWIGMYFNVFSFPNSIHSSGTPHSHKKRKDSLKTRAVLLIFWLELQISGMAAQRIHQNSEKWWLLRGIAQWKLPWGCFNRFLLLWLWCQRFWGNSENRYRSKRLSQMLYMCYSLLNSQNISISNSQKRLVTFLLGHLRRS